MTTIEKDECPLCGRLAEYRYADHGNRTTYDCESRTQFQVSRRAEKLVRELATDQRLRLAKLAVSAGEDWMLVIRIPKLHLPKLPKQPLAATIELRSELPD